MPCGLLFAGPHSRSSRPPRRFCPVSGSTVGRRRAHWRPTGALALILGALLLGTLLQGFAGAQTLATPSRSTTIALTPDELFVLVVNREANSLSVIRVR